MGINFRKRVKIAPGINLNFSKNGVSASVGPKGAKINIGKKGTYLNTSIPGTGIYSRTKIGGSGLNKPSQIYDTPQVSDAQVKATMIILGIGIIAVLLVLFTTFSILATLLTGVGVALVLIVVVLASGNTSSNKGSSTSTIFYKKESQKGYENRIYQENLKREQRKND